MQNMRLIKGFFTSDLDEVSNFSKRILNTGDNKEREPNDGEAVEEILDET